MEIKSPLYLRKQLLIFYKKGPLVDSKGDSFFPLPKPPVKLVSRDEECIVVSGDAHLLPLREAHLCILHINRKEKVSHATHCEYKSLDIAKMVLGKA